jgi:hypothetical protein
MESVLLFVLCGILEAGVPLSLVAPSFIIGLSHTVTTDGQTSRKRFQISDSGFDQFIAQNL